MLRASRRQPFRLLVQTVSVLATGYQDLRPCYPAALPATDCAGWCPASRLEGRASIQGTLPVRVHRHTPLQSPPALTLRAVPARVLEAVFPSALCRSLPGAGSLRSAIPCTVKARHPSLQRPPPEPTLRYASGPLWFRDSKPGVRINGSANLNDITRSAHQPLIL